MIIKTCLVCKKDFQYRNCPSDIKNGNGKHCGRECAAKSLSKKIEKTCVICNNLYEVHKFRAEKSKTCSYECRNIMYKTGWKWEDNMSKYHKLHHWIRNLKGKASKCIFCGGSKSQYYNWANKSDQYKKEEDDWMELCMSCHHSFDRARHALDSTFNSFNIK